MDLEIWYISSMTNYSALHTPILISGNGFVFPADKYKLMYLRMERDSRFSRR